MNYNRYVDPKEYSLSIPDLTFTKKDCAGVTYPHNDPLVVTIDIANRAIHRVLIDSGSSVNVLFKSTFDQLSIGDEYLTSCPSSVTGFTGQVVIPAGKIPY